MTHWDWLVTFVVGTLGTARAVRLVVFDDYPPSIWFREHFRVWVRGSAWEKIVDCAFCCAPYLAAANMAYGWFSGFHWTWWVLNLWGAVSYLAAIVVAYDQPE